MDPVAHRHPLSPQATARKNLYLEGNKEPPPFFTAHRSSSFRCEPDTRQRQSFAASSSRPQLARRKSSVHPLTILSQPLTDSHPPHRSISTHAFHLPDATADTPGMRRDSEHRTRLRRGFCGQASNIAEVSRSQKSGQPRTRQTSNVEMRGGREPRTSVASATKSQKPRTKSRGYAATKN